MDAERSITDALPGLISGQPGATARFLREAMPLLRAEARRTLWRRCEALCWNVQQEVDDLVQDVLLALWAEELRPLHRFRADGGRSLEAYLRRFARMRIQDRLRLRRHLFWERATQGARLERAANLRENEAPVPAPMPEATLVQRDLLRRALAQVAGWGESERQLVAVLFAEEAAVQEVAAEMGVPVGALYQRKHRLGKRLQRLRLELAEDRGGLGSG